MRGQTTLDFAIGITIFLAVILFVFTFVPGILSPFDMSGEEKPALSNRIANSLSQGMLGSSEQPYVLDRYCTVEFFDEDRTSAPDDCAYSGSTLDTRLDLSSTQNINVTLNADLDSSGETTQLCWEPEDEAEGPDLLERGSCSSSGVTLATGDEPPGGTQTTITTRRVVSLHGQPVTLEVVIW